MPSPAIHIDPARVIAPVDRRIYSGFTEHMGRCIYGGIYEPKNPHGLSDEKTGLRKDVLALLKELRPPLLRYPGGYVYPRFLRVHLTKSLRSNQELCQYIPMARYAPGSILHLQTLTSTFVASCRWRWTSASATKASRACVADGREQRVWNG